jgi:hypothetical protein
LAAKAGYIEIGRILLKKTDTATIIAAMKAFPSTVYKILNNVQIIKLSQIYIPADIFSSTDIKFFTSRDPIKGDNDEQVLRERYKLEMPSSSSDWSYSCSCIEYSIPVYQARRPVFLNACLDLSSKLNKADLFDNEFMYALTGIKLYIRI